MTSRLSPPPVRKYCRSQAAPIAPMNIDRTGQVSILSAGRVGRGLRLPRFLEQCGIDVDAFLAPGSITRLTSGTAMNNAATMARLKTEKMVSGGR